MGNSVSALGSNCKRVFFKNLRRRADSEAAIEAERVLNLENLERERERWPAIDKESRIKVCRLGEAVLGGIKIRSGKRQ
ncbi:hypothetical protein L484_018389 [Morus notabilis]|uniref:Uncharacterized protein n=1 Tax=Morus notabilis TaxID=981085 RepID=W9QMQ9_9ROSA|nr:hypothetical protein L484_018389 [Morus notabilis]